MLAGARLQRRRRQPPLWPMNADPPPPPWVWMVPGSAGLLRLGAGVAPPPVLLAAAQPPAAPLLPGLPGWQVPGEPLLPLVPLPSAPDPAAAAHRHPLLHGQVTCPRPRPGPRVSAPPPARGRGPGRSRRPRGSSSPAPRGPGSPKRQGAAWQPCIGNKVHALTSRSASRYFFCPQYFPWSRSQAFQRPVPHGRSRGAR